MDEVQRTRKKKSVSARFSAPWTSPSLLYSGCRVKPVERGVNHPPSSSAEVKDGVELYLYSPSERF